MRVFIVDILYSLCQRYSDIQSKLNEIPETTAHLVELTEFIIVTNDKTVFALLNEVQVRKVVACSRYPSLQLSLLILFLKK